MNTALAIADAFHAIITHPGVRRFSITRALIAGEEQTCVEADRGGDEPPVMARFGPTANIVQVRLALEAIVAKLPKA